MAMATFEVSSFGRLYVTNEGLNYELPTIRYIFVFVTLVLGFFILLKLLLYQFWKLSHKSSPKSANSTSGLSTSLFTLYFISYAIHTIHYADNIYRPVDYLEPKWLYVKYVLCEMEITFFANFPISLVGYFTIVSLLQAIQSGKSQLVRKYCKRIVFYILGSLLTLGHYRTEPPTKYSAFVNFTIAGEGIVTILFSGVVWIAWKQCKSGELLNDGQEVEDLLGNDLEMMSRPVRRRSKTPVN